MLKNEAVLAEISREVPERFKNRRGFIINIYNASVFEKYDEQRRIFIYTAMNNDTGESEIVQRSKEPLSSDEKSLIKFALKIRNSKVSGLGRIEVAEGISFRKLKTIARELFLVILPKYNDFKVRKEQVLLAENLLDAIAERRTMFAEAPTGLGKTIVYIIIGLLVLRSGINKTMSGSYFPEMSYVEWMRMGILVSTSSIALQQSICTEVIPSLSKIFIEWGIIREPITVILRKGKEHYICEYNLNEHIRQERNLETKKVLETLLIDERIIDLAEVGSLSLQIKKRINVPHKCYENCPYAECCRYRSFRNSAADTGYDFVVCNHQLLLADMKLRSTEERAVLPPFQTIILDEAHKVLPAARSLYGFTMPADTIPSVTKALLDLNFTPSGKPETDGWKIIRNAVHRLSGKLYEVNKKLFSRHDAGEQCDNVLRLIRDIADKLYTYLSSSHEFMVMRDERLKHGILWDLQHISNTANELFDNDVMIRWFDTDNDDKRTAIGGIPKNLNERLYADLWSRGIPTMLTSGTLSINGNFSALKQSLGLNNMNLRIAEGTYSSPFNYTDNCLLYISDNVPDYRTDGYIDKAVDEIEMLIKASNGHAAILFTSYKSMRVVHKRLKQRMPNMKDFVLERSTSAAIERFKESRNGVLFACGSMWEGIDCPGDILSLLIIVKLPFAQPDAINEYEQTKYPSFGYFFDNVLMPDMLIKLKQGFGRLLRTETDTGCVAILDNRAGTNGIYRNPVINALPKCNVTADIADIESFFKVNKAHDYFTE